MTPRFSHFLSKIHNLTIHCRSTLGNSRCQNIQAIDIVTADMKLLLFVIYIHFNTFAAKHLKNQNLSAKHVSRTPECKGYMGPTQSISGTIQPIAVKLSQKVANI